MTQPSQAQTVLRALPVAEWESWLLAHSGLPGPRGNLEVVAAAADLATAAQMRAWLTPSDSGARYGSATEFLPVCGAAGLGRLLVEAEGDPPAQARLLEELQALAQDPRWRVREGVAMALQRWGAAAMPKLLDAMAGWATSAHRLVQRAVVAALCEPRNLRDAIDAQRVVVLLDGIMATLVGAVDRRDDDFRVLRQALGYGWSVAVVACPRPGRAAMDAWLGDAEADVRWVMRENLGKKRLLKLDAAWVAASQAATAR
jgi:hypothetical protein